MLRSVELSAGGTRTMHRCTIRLSSANCVWSAIETYLTFLARYLSSCYLFTSNKIFRQHVNP